MTTARPGAYAAHRPYVVVESLDDLHGPTEGVVELPHAIDWSLGRSYDLGDADRTRWMYTRVIREAGDVEQLKNLLDRGLLIDLWPTLVLPVRVREMWEWQHPVLVGAAER